MSKPIITEGLNYYDLEWTDEQVKIRAGRFMEKDDGLKGEVTITTTSSEVPAHLHQAQFNFSSTTTRTRLANDLKKRIDISWDNILEQLCVHVLKQYRRGENVVTLWNTTVGKPPEYLLHPLILKNEVNMIFGEGGAGKSYLSLFLAAVATQGVMDNPLNITPLQSGEVIVPMLLDWETHPDIIQWRWKMVLNGLGLADQEVGLLYRQCALSLVEDLEQIQNNIQDCGANFVIIDSVGAASKGDINKQEVATELMNAARRLKTTILLIHHTSKDLQGKKTPFGSVYFQNASRSIFEVRKTQSEGEDKTTIAIQHTKYNYSKKAIPLGAEIVFSDEQTIFKAIDVKEVPEFQDLLPADVRLYGILQEFGSKTVLELAGRANIGKDAVLDILGRKRDKFVCLVSGKDKYTDKWGIMIL
jgi:archaellum biogenesis ATPase FlaH